MSPKNKILQELHYSLVCKLAPSKINGAGVGVFAVNQIESGEVVFSTTNNQFISWSEVQNISINVLNYIKQICNNNEYGFYIDCNLDKIYLAYYVNHSDSPNLYHNLVLDYYTALREILPGEELTCKYTLNEIDWV
jgi:SET domain-containing protein